MKMVMEVKCHKAKVNFKIYDATDRQTNTQPALACSRSTIETVERGVKYVQS